MSLTPLPPAIEEIHQKALKGHLLEIVQWGQILLKSVHVPPNPSEAFAWFKIASDAGFGPGQNMLGRCFQFGWGCHKDLLQAASLYEKAAQTGYEWGRYNLGILIMRGMGQPQNLPKAFDLFRIAAQNGHAKSMNLYARFLEEGWGTVQNTSDALIWYRKSAENGDYRGQHNYATALVDKGKIDEALDWWRKAILTATSDILLAMHRQITALHDDKDPDLLAHVEERLKEMGIRPPHPPPP
ncbi:tetratricopeptide repeat protein [Swingsia samuiensis]|uniref:Sel1 repeat family protein n=1 Tax=Swingsia samuiensis TaxID=1293412 RepID=A0A4Y6UL43_9PROT|nr:tetratricopeptide repeat protein [Swingsia samuiensis]QDH16755.1 sel1 repeat family protein [Swingsia samuiensis]